MRFCAKKVLLCALLPGLLLAGEASREQKGIDNVESGWRFGGEKDREESRKRGVSEILSEMLKVQKEQLKTQKEILAILQSQFDPKPRKIKLPDGTECIANSSAECFEMPITPAAKRIPVLANWLKEPTKENAREWLRWQAKYLSRTFDNGYSTQFAIAQWGNEAYPMSFQRNTFDTPTGYNTVLVKKENLRLLNHVSDKFDLILFFGKDWDMDFFAFDAYAELAKKLPDVSFTLVFRNSGSKKAFFDAGKTFVDLGRMLKRSRIVVGENYFEKFNVYTTPTLVVRTRKDNHADTLMVGRLGSDAIAQKIVGLLEYREVIPRDHSTDWKAWKNSGSYAKEHIRHYYGVDLNTTYIQDQYK